MLVKLWGILGIILATLFSLFFINFIFGARILFQQYFQNDKLHEFFADQAKYFFVTAITAVVCVYVCNAVTLPTPSAVSVTNNKIVQLLYLFLRSFLCTVLTASLYYLIYHQSEQFQDAKIWFKKRYRLFRG